MNLQNYKIKYDQLSIKKNLSSDKAMEAVKQDGYALQYVNSNMFLSDNNDEIIEVNGKKYKLIK